MLNKSNKPNTTGKIQDKEIFIFPTNPNYQGDYGIKVRKREQHNRTTSQY